MVAFLPANRVSILPWPSRSPDFNPIDHFWDVIGNPAGTQRYTCACWGKGVLETSLLVRLCETKMKPYCTAHMFDICCLVVIRVKWFFYMFYIRKYFIFLCWFLFIDFFSDFNVNISGQCCENFRIWRSGTCWKPASNLHTDFCRVDYKYKSLWIFIYHFINSV